MAMKVYLDREYMDYLVETHNEWNEDNLVTPAGEFFELCGITGSCSNVYVHVSCFPGYDRLTLPTDVFAGRDDFVAGLNEQMGL